MNGRQKTSTDGRDEGGREGEDSLVDCKEMRMRERERGRGREEMRERNERMNE